MHIAELSWSGGHARKPEKEYHLTISEWSLKDYLLACAYHWYDMHIPIRIPGWKRFEKWLAKHGAEHRHGFMGDEEPRWRDRLYGWSVEQDFNCYEWSQKGRVIQRLDLDPEIGKRYERGGAAW